MTEFSTIVYKDVGPYQRRGGTYSTVTINDQADLDAALAAGCVTHPDLIEQAPAADKAGKPATDDNAPPTRAEMEAKATELGIEFTGRTSDKKLLGLIDAALASKE